MPNLALKYFSFLSDHNQHLVNTINSIWTAQEHVAYYSDFSTTPEAVPHTLHALQRQCFKLRSPVASHPTIFYAIRLGHVPGICTSWPDAQPQTVSTLANVKRFSSPSPRDPGFEDPTAHLFRDGSALPSGPAGWGVHITVPASDNTPPI